MSIPGRTPGTPPTSLVVDASVVIKWHVAEDHSEAASRLLRDDAPLLHVPDLTFSEVGNTLWKKVRRGELTEDQARGIAHLVVLAPLTVHLSAPLVEAALEIALHAGRTVYDSLYIALAVHLDSRLVTADEKLYNALKDGPLGDRITWVEDDLGLPAATDAEDYEIDVNLLTSDYNADEIELLYSFHTSNCLVDADLVHLKGIAADLPELYLTGPGITDAGMVNLRDLVNLRVLDLPSTSITDAGLTYVGCLHRLRSLNLRQTAITDAGLAHLSRLTELHKLVLWGTRVTDAGLVHLRALSELRELDLEETEVSETGVEELRRALPDVEITR